MNKFPDLQWLKKQAESNFSARRNANGEALKTAGWPMVILNVNATQTFRDNIKGPISIFTNITGQSFVEAERRRVKVNEGFFFVTNHDQYYTLEIDNRKTETFNIHFGEHFADEVIRTLSPAEKLLDEAHFSKPISSVSFYNRIRPKTEDFNRIIIALKSEKNKSLSFDENLYELMSLLISDLHHDRSTEEKLGAVKYSTRKELLKRLHLAKDYIYSFYDKDLSLDELAAACLLSRFHFLRLFKIAFSKTPYQFVNEVRMTRAKELLQCHQMDIHTISRSVGVKDPSSFSRMFHKFTGSYPSEFRKNL